MSELPTLVLVVLGGIVVIIGLGLFLIQRRLRRDNGTLYYVSILSQEMRDQHEVNARILSERYSASCFVPAQSNPREKFGIVDDFSSAVREAKGRLIGRLDDDAPGTGFHVAPNMLWQSAMSLGFDVDWPDGTEFIELPPRLRLDPKKGPQPGDLVSWRIGQAVPNDAGLVVPEERAVVTDPARDARAVSIVAELTDGGGATPQPWPVAATYRIGVFDDSDDQSHPVEVDTDPVLAAARRRKSNVTDDVAVVHPETAALICHRVIRTVLHRHPNALVLLNFRVPKTVALRIGDLLQTEGKAPGNPGCGHDGCLNESCREPWARLIPLRYDISSGAYRVTRVHESQPTAVEMDAAVKGIS